MIAEITGENKKIMKTGHYQMIPEFLEMLFHESLKYSQPIHEDKRYPYPLQKKKLRVMKAVSWQLSELRWI